jgi:hypothetical protein
MGGWKMPQTLPSKKNLVVVCPDACSFHPDKIGDEATAILRAMREEGAGSPKMAKRAEELLGRPVPPTSMGRHVKHYRELAPDEPDPVAAGPRPSDVVILDAIIGAGFKFSARWRPTIKDTLDAIKLKSALTGQSAFEDMLRAMEAGLDLADGDLDEPENPEALGLADEQGPDHDDDA